MATISSVKGTRPLPSPIVGNGVVHNFSWTGLGAGDDGAPIELNGAVVDFVVQAVGVFSGGATVALEGSNDGVNWTTMKDETGTAIDLGQNDLAGVSVIPALMRPVVQSGDGGADIDVSAILRIAGD